MINGAHVILYSNDAEADRRFLRDVLGFPHVDSGGGWLIFALPPAEVAVHPTEGAEQHEFFLQCDDLDATLTDLAERGVGLADPVSEQPWGRLCALRLPGGGRLGLYQPSHPTASVT